MVAGMVACAVVAVAVPALAAMPPATCRVTYVKTWDSSGRFGANITIDNMAPRITSWRLTFTWPGTQRVDNGWYATWSQSGRNVTAVNLPYNGTLDQGQRITIGFNGSYTGTNAPPALFLLNGVGCLGPNPPVTPTPTPSPTPTPDPARVDNPYAGADGYVDPTWSAAAAGEPGGAAVARTSTGVWLDRVSRIAGTSSVPGLRAHLDEAVRQDAANGATPLTIQIVLNDLPDRNCLRYVSTGDFAIAADGLDQYRTRYVDPIASILADPAYRRLRIVAVVEPDFLPGLVMPTGTMYTIHCEPVRASGVYPLAVRYALNRLYGIPNVYTYLDASNHGRIGWADNFGPAAELLASIGNATGDGLPLVHGFTVNTAEWAALTEPFFTASTVISGTPVKWTRWVDWNDYVDELSFAQAFRNRLIAAGFPPTIGMVIDTSRNGWGGPARPRAPSTSTDVNTFVDQSRMDRRVTVANWCNQTGTGLGERPRADPAPGIDAYAWIKPPGVSDGAAAADVVPNPENIPYDQRCNPLFQEPRGAYVPGQALPNAPVEGQWFPALFRQLLANAYPPL
ncbi:glycoside hydrolase family 6 protein [Sphaerisporangium melleum]|uniref:glycoside hydrolase family 6 protein n=1 Tax=Sphaerisporangium melleum TaxID=321316 RepID=UPI00166F3999|nr:glycoside hydrolase family 6 protein [Sphaerisporangium melleum]